MANHAERHYFKLFSVNVIFLVDLRHTTGFQLLSVNHDRCHMWGRKCSLFPVHLISLPLGSSWFHPFIIYRLQNLSVFGLCLRINDSGLMTLLCPGTYFIQKHTKVTASPPPWFPARVSSGAVSGFARMFTLTRGHPLIRHFLLRTYLILKVRHNRVTAEKNRHTHYKVIHNRLYTESLWRKTELNIIKLYIIDSTPSHCREKQN